MTSFSSVAEVMVAEHAPLNGEFRSRLAVSSLTTGLDIGILMVVGRAAFQCIPFSLMMPDCFFDSWPRCTDLAWPHVVSYRSELELPVSLIPFCEKVRAADLLLCYSAIRNLLCTNGEP